MAKQKKRRYGVNFDIGFYVEVMAQSEEEAEDIAKDNMHRADEGEVHNFDAELIGE